MAKPPVPTKLTPVDFAIYGALSVLFEAACAFTGTALDCTAGTNGGLDLTKISDGIAQVIASPELLFIALSNTNSYAVKCVLFGFMGEGLFLLYKYSEGKKRLHRQGTEHGSAKWCSQKDMKLLADKKKTRVFKPLLTADGKRVFDKKGRFSGVYIDNNILLTKHVKLSLNARQHRLNFNILLIGGSGAGKTRFFVEPNIMQLNTSYVITDPKGEILQATGKMLTEAGYVVRVLNLIEMQHSNNYNPFHYVYDQNGKLSSDYIKKMINVLFESTKGDGEKTDFWSQKGQSMLEAIVFLLFEESEYHAKFDENGEIIEATRDKTHLNFFSVTEKMRRLQYPPHGSQKPDGFFLERGENESEEDFKKRQNDAFLCPLDRDFLELKRRKPDSLAYRLYCEVRNAPEETGQSFLSSANVKTFMFNMENMRNLTCCDNIELEMLGERKSALFLIISATDRTYNFMPAMLYTQLFDVLSIQASFKHKGTLPVHVRCIMDEFANIAQIPNFDQIIAIVRSWGVSVNVILQSLSQIKAKYKDTWETIVGCCDSFLFLGGKEESTLKYISEALGKETIDVRGHNKTKGKQPSTSENNSIMGRELMQPNEIASMPITDCILLIRSQDPIYDGKLVLEEHVNYKFLEGYDPNNAFDVKTIHAVTVAEFMQQNKKVDIYVTNPQMPEEQAEMVTTVFKAEEQTITFETYEEASLYGEIAENTIEEEYSEDTPKYGKVSKLESFDLGEPDENAVKEVVKDESEPDPVSLNEEPEPDTDLPEQYGDPEDYSSIDDLGDVFAESAMSVTEHYAEAAFGLYKTDTYGLSLNEEGL